MSYADASTCRPYWSTTHRVSSKKTQRTIQVQEGLAVYSGVELRYTGIVNWQKVSQILHHCHFFTFIGGPFILYANACT